MVRLERSNEEVGTRGEVAGIRLMRVEDPLA